MKKIISMLLCLTLIFALSVPAFAASSSTDGTNAITGYVTGDVVNLRRTPDGDILGVVLYGDTFDLLGTNGGWYHVLMTSGQNSGVEGYISTEYAALNV